MSKKYPYGPPWPIAVNPSPSADAARGGSKVTPAMTKYDEALRLLREVFETEVGADFIEGEDSDYGVDALKRRKVWQAIAAFLADKDIPAAREEVLVKDIETLREMAHDFYESGRPITYKQLTAFCAVGPMLAPSAESPSRD